MRKLKLTLENLTVETFEAQPGHGADTGTVHGLETSTCHHDAYSCNGGCSNLTNCPFNGECGTAINTCQGSCWDVQYASECGGSCLEVC